MRRWRGVDPRMLLAPISASELKRLLEDKPTPWRRGEASEVLLQRCGNCHEWITENGRRDGICRACGALIPCPTPATPPE